MHKYVHFYECIDKGGLYRLIMTAKPAGTATEEAVFYQCEDTGQAYWRYASDFDRRMRLVRVTDGGQ